MCIVVNKYGVVLRNWKNQDVQDYAALVSDPEVMRYIRDGSTRSHETAVVEIQRFRQEIANRGWSRWVLTVAETGEFIGYIGFADTHMGIDLGGRTKKKFWNTAYPYIGFFLAMQYGFEVLGFKAVYTRTNVLNSRALKMNLKLLGCSEVKATLFETTHAPRIRIDYTRELFDQIKERNIERIERFHQRLTRRSKFTSESML